MALWDEITFDKLGDGFDTLLGAYLKREQIKASGGATAAAINDQAQLIGTPASVTENTNARPATPEQLNGKAAAVVAASDRVNVMGVEMSKTVLYAALAIGAGIVLAKVL